MRLKCSIVCLFALAITLPAAADTVVAGTTSIWLAGQPSGTSVNGYFGADDVPDNSPVQFAIGGTTVTFSASGSTSVDGSCYSGADGSGCYSDESGDSPAPWSTNYNGPADALIGIFTSGTPTLETVGGYTGPVYATGPDYQSSANTGPGTYSPVLDQIFLIGTGAGETFVVPTGATGLYVAVADSIGGSTGNLGDLEVTASFAGSTVTATPEPSGLALLGTGIVGLAGIARRRFSK